MSLIKETILDFNLNKDELECLEIHNLFKQNQVYEELKEIPNLEKIKVWYNCEYNDNWYDLKPVYMDIINSKDEVFKKVYPAWSPDEIDFRKTNPNEGHMLAFIVTKQMI
jgi:hypothetical protein